MNISDIDTVAVKGFLDPGEGERLYHLAREASLHGPVLEIGGYCGRSTLYLGLGCRENRGILYSIDHHRGSEEQQPGQEYFDPDLFDEREGKVDTFRFFRRAVEQAGLTDTVVPIVAASEVAVRRWSTPLAMLFIDGGHTYPDAFADYISWSVFLMPGGILAIHDIFPDASLGGQAPHYIYKLATASGLYEELPMVKTLGVLRRRGPADIPAELYSRRDW
ncbi:MAG TPA: class I SAM-dependent methyltransferase [Deltaproteobacteria bacterium]|nr:class I SAM-dependent methyltransferase [Deltaproteobacteria bacterium]HPR54590.1 class I SAM-dependent methyltransferase [Deltaproteobacteria bacterium]HXK48020.1 class I SAM-dependent methyltransferase [Deltaproteobacteria bacterium]